MYSSVPFLLASPPAAGQVLPVSPQVGWVTEVISTAPAAVYIAGAVIAVMIPLVIWPAVWSRSDRRRKDAQRVLDILLQALISTLKAIADIVRYWRS